ncbi:hypothetical protein [Mucilaginibacter flavidus]|uniref:hypothetical protein n=1 Tax=Mucilaginibacter flavidus TaxID=2949309 RepID=UPI0020922F7A|nr:hypothetical protein [Mucilaginibacter flavidus]MCO5948454.1 hypothetical protein [Mucilaginibacter flavidus]
MIISMFHSVPGVPRVKMERFSGVEPAVRPDCGLVTRVVCDNLYGVQKVADNDAVSCTIQKSSVVGDNTNNGDRPTCY